MGKCKRIIKIPVRAGLIKKEDTLGARQLANFSAFILESEIDYSSEEEDINLVTEELEKAGIDAEHSEEQVLELIKKLKAELKLERGRGFKEKFVDIASKLKSNFNEINEKSPELALAYRKLENSSESDDIKDDKEKIKIIEHIKKKS